MASKGDQDRIRVLSYNIHKGFSVANRRFTLHEIRSAVSQIEPDIVFLQEVLGRHDRHASRISTWPELSQYEFLAQGQWPYVAYGQTATFNHGHQGNAILSKYPILEYENIDISTNPIECRSLLHVVIDIPFITQPVHCVCVHLNLFRKGREMQLRSISDRVNRAVGTEDPLIIAGDFNDWPRRASRILSRRLDIQEVFYRRYGAYARSYPTRYPLFHLDRVYARGLALVDGYPLVGSPWNALSDHFPLYAELQVDSV
jgi:endonuclease/exonuclease/phosphatase family metal-dependent hydrolase